ncbi:TetR/AcrR family transcriptional regulator [Lewinella sp. 4G2]|uniref:TetR/AcrR family transcriptional regulator n=1 Tax=Lewinella sp. 4G2 TaxID=1803372 RepID=UPI0018D2F8D2|nr:TetR/AcrR family transcriptional regulator [Lewinella sp. 4G2]
METIEPTKVSPVLCSVNELEVIERKLIETATEMYMRLGIRSVSMDDVAREMGVSKKTIYTVVDNKEELVRKVMYQDTCKDLEVIVANHAKSRDAIDELLMNSRYHIREMRNISPTTIHDLQKYYPEIWSKEVRGHQDHFENSIRENLERGMEEGLYRDDLDSAIIAKFFVASVVMMIDRQIFPARERPLSEIIRQHFIYHCNGIVNQFGRDRMEQYLQQESLD